MWDDEELTEAEAAEICRAAAEARARREAHAMLNDALRALMSPATRRAKDAADCEAAWPSE